MNSETFKRRFPNHQRGAVLVLALIFLLLTALIASTLMSTSAIDLKMATNEQFRIEAEQRAEGVADSIFDDLNTTNADGYLMKRGERLCVTTDTNTHCVADGSIALDTTVESALVETGVSLKYYLEHRGANVPVTLVSDESQASGSSESHDLYEIRVDYDASDLKQGRSSAAMGVVYTYVSGTGQERRESGTNPLLREIDSRG